MKPVDVRYLILPLILIGGTVNASWVSEITGVDIDLNRGTIDIKPPNINAIPPMIQNLPKDVGQALLDPNSPLLATAIRFSRGQALNRGVKLIPENIKQTLASYFPSDILNKVRWTTADGISLDGMLKNWFNQEGAITYDEVVVFANQNLVGDVGLWAHELTHVLQYSQMGVETFAFQYSHDWNSLESQARENSRRIIESINSTQQGHPATWGYSGNVAQVNQQVQWGQLNQIAMKAIPPQQCIWIDTVHNTTGNACPINIRVAGVVVQPFNAPQYVMPCNEPTCIIPAGQSGPLLSPPGTQIIGVTAAYQLN
ncbi:eCIS core domain-containing protein [Serratia marcescens]|uniref:eCIS core domain-containing protein n=1 Tax=Serratia marcescens TaxID=615 RepID=UPI0008FC089E|nr:DUF4157 domain-containing protein [Serratia marcescens]